MSEAPRGPSPDGFGDEEETPTAPGVDRVPRSYPPSAQGASSTERSASIAYSPAELMERRNVRRLHTFSKLMMVTCALAMLPFVVIRPSWQVALFGVGSLACILLGYRILWARTADPGRWAFDEVAPAGVVAVCSSVAVAMGYGFGVFSPVPYAAGLCTALLYTAQFGPERMATYVFAPAGLMYVLTVGAVVLGWIPDIGLFADPRGTPMLTMLMTATVTTLALVATYVVGRANRSHVADLVERIDSATRQAARRQALLFEAREELHRAEDLALEGRFSGVELGSFRLGELIGRGGMGEVYEGSDVRSGREVAIKLIRRELLSSKDVILDFEREARAVASLHHPHVVEVIEVGGLEARLPYIAMERLRGTDLSSLLRERERLDVDEAVTMVEEVCAGLGAAHEAGLIHRDLKPHNLFLHRGEVTPRWKILDFGTFQAHGEAGGDGNRLVGTPAYMSPEQARGDAGLDHRTDLYGLAVVAYRALTGVPAFRPQRIDRLMQAVAEAMPRAPDPQLRVPEDLWRAVRIGLAKDRDARFASAAEMAEGFRRAAEGRLSEDLRERADGLLRTRPWS